MPAILIVDDDASLRLVLAEWLHDAGYQVLHASDGHQALDLITARSPDLVLSDIQMPHLDGLALLEQVQAGGNAPPWILMSGDLRRPPLGPVPFLPKPFEIDVLLDLIDRLLAG